MARRKLAEYIRDPYLIHEISVEEINRWIEEYPYVSALHSLLALKLRDSDQKDFQKAMYTGAMYSTDLRKFHKILQIDNGKSHIEEERTETFREAIKETKQSKGKAEQIRRPGKQNVLSTDENEVEIKPGFEKQQGSPKLEAEQVQTQIPAPSSEIEPDIDLDLISRDVLEKSDVSEGERAATKEVGVEQGFIHLTNRDIEEEIIDSDTNIDILDPVDIELAENEETSLDSFAVPHDRFLIDEDLTLFHANKPIDESVISEELEKTSEEPAKIGDQLSADVMDIQIDALDAEPAEEETNQDESHSHTPADWEGDNNGNDSASGGLSDFSEWLLSLDHDQPHTMSNESQSDELISPTLAELLASQGHISKAINMYQKLILINPEKSSFFAAQIEKLKAI